MNNKRLASNKESDLRILLMPPMGRRHQRYVSPAPFPDIGLGYLAATCKKAGAEVTLLSWNQNLTMKALQSRLMEWRPDIVGIKIITTDFIEALQTLQCVRDALPDAIILIGGPHPTTSRPEDLFIEFDGLFDYAMAGDGEAGIAALIERIRTAGGKPRQKTLRDVPGLIYRDRNGISCNKLCLDAELDTLAPLDWSMQLPAGFNLNKQNGDYESPIMDSRGCPAQCSFCKCSMINGARPRHRSLKYIFKEIEQLVDIYGVRTLIFTGNTLFSDVDYVRELCRWFIKFDKPLEWRCTASAFERNLLDPELLQLMRKSGCSLIYFGIESGSPEVRERINQPISLPECTETVKLTAEAGICPSCYFMFGHPEETVRDMNESMKYAVSLPTDRIFFSMCFPLPSTLNYYALLKKYKLDRIDSSTYDFSYPKLLPSKASIYQIRYKFYEANLLFRSKFARRFYRWVH